MNYLRKSNERGRAHFGWLASQHSFSFGSYYDPAHMGLSALRVINDDTVAPGAGFDTHSHQNMEIISYILEGTIEHRDSQGHHDFIPAGEVQRMSAGTGVSHSEFNASSDSPLHFLQIWIQPNQRDIEPSYEQRRIEQNGALTPLVTPDEGDGALHIHQDARIYRLRLQPGESHRLSTIGNHAYLHTIHGAATVETPQDGEQSLRAGDALGGRLETEEQVVVTASDDSVYEALWFDLP